MIENFIGLLACLMPLYREYIIFFVALMFVATVPNIIRKVVDFV